MNALELPAFRNGLERHFHGRMQYRNGYKTDLNSFCIVKVAHRNPFRLEGHLSGPRGKNAQFSVSVDAASHQIFIQVKSQGLAGCTREAAVKEISYALSMMMERVANGPVPGRIGTKHWLGFYLVNLGERSIGKSGLAHFDEAVRIGLISPAFKESCLEYGFTMLKRA